MKKTSVALAPSDAPAPTARNTVVLVGHEASVDRLVELNATITSAKGEMDEIRGTLDAAADGLRVETEQETGHACKSMQARGSNANGKYTFADRYAPVDLDDGPKLREFLGKKHFGKLFESAETIKLKPEAAGRLLELLRELDRADEFLAVDPCIRPVESFREVRAGLRRALSATQNEQLDRVVAQIAERPRLSLK